MPQISLPSDLAAELTEAMYWYRAEPAMKVLAEHIRAEVPWSERRPRQLLRWADQRAVPIFGHKRFVLVLNAGFACPQRWSLWRVAAVELRRARAAIARGEENAIAYAGGRDLLAFGESAPQRWAPDGWGAVSGSYPSPAGAPPAPATTPAPASPAPSAPSAPGAPRPSGGWITR